MRLYTNEAIRTSRNLAAKLTVKLASLKPTDDFTLDDISNLMFILDQYDKELQSIEWDRIRAKRQKPSSIGGKKC